MTQNEYAGLVANDGNIVTNGTIHHDIPKNEDNIDTKHVRSNVELTSLNKLDKAYLKELFKENDKLKKQSEETLPNHERMDTEFKDNLNEFLKHQTEIFNDICNPNDNSNDNGNDNSNNTENNDDINDTNSDSKKYTIY